MLATYMPYLRYVFSRDINRSFFPASWFAALTFAKCDILQALFLGLRSMAHASSEVLKYDMPDNEWEYVDLAMKMDYSNLNGPVRITAILMYVFVFIMSNTYTLADFTAC